MSLLAWIILGALAGLVASRLEGQRGAWSLSTGHAGIAGAIIGGLLFDRVGPAAVTDSVPYDMLVTGLRPIGIAAAYHQLFALRTRASEPSDRALPRA